MTFMSLFVEKHETRAAAMTPHVPGADYAILGSLNAYTWPVSLKAFADENGLAIEWVDNCWTRVCVDASQLRAFLTAGKDERSTMPGKIEDSGWFVINEEEF